MIVSRIPLTLAFAVSLEEVKARARVCFDDEDLGIQTLADTATAEIEAHCGLALLAQTVTLTLHSWCKRIPLPIGPFWVEGLPDHPIIVELIDDAGNVTPHPAGWWLQNGRYPVLNLTAPASGAALRITYPAGYGLHHSAIPADLRLAITDHASMMYDVRGMEKAPQGLSLAASRIAARHRRVAI